MTDPTSIIVYRNPLEYQLWNSGLVFPIIVGMVLTGFAVVLVDKLARKCLSWKTYNKNSGIIASLSGVLAMGLTLWVML